MMDYADASTTAALALRAIIAITAWLETTWPSPVVVDVLRDVASTFAVADVIEAQFNRRLALSIKAA